MIDIPHVTLVNEAVCTLGLSWHSKKQGQQ